MDGGAEPLTSAGRECDVTFFLFFSTLPGTSASADSAAAKPREASLLASRPASPHCSFSRVRQHSFLQPLVKMTEHVWFCYCGFTYNVSWCGGVSSQPRSEIPHGWFSAGRLLNLFNLQGEQRRCCSLADKERPCRFQMVNW